MKRYLLLVVLLIFIGCARTSPYAPVAHPDQRIVFEGLSFYLPKGENWEMATKPVARIVHEEFGRSTLKVKIFKKTIVGQNQKPEKQETIWAEVVKYEFALLDFNHVDGLRDLIQSPCISVNALSDPTRYGLPQGFRLVSSGSYGHEWLQLQSHCKMPYELGQFVLESNILDKEFKGMNCVKENTRIQTGRKVSDSPVAFIRYIQAYACVHPKNSKQILELRAIQELPKGQTPTDIQNEIDYFFNSLEVHGLP